MSEDSWDIADATAEVVDEILGDLTDDPGFIRRVLEFADKDMSEENVRTIKVTLAEIIQAARDF